MCVCSGDKACGMGVRLCEHMHFGGTFLEDNGAHEGLPTGDMKDLELQTLEAPAGLCAMLKLPALGDELDMWGGDISIILPMFAGEACARFGNADANPVYSHYIMSYTVV